MIKILLLSIFLFSTICFSQTKLNVDSISNDQLIKVFNNCQLIKEIKTDNLSIRVFLLGNESGSAGFNNCEITHDIYIAVSEFGEVPSQSLFRIKDLYSADFNSFRIVNNDKVAIKISYINNDTKYLNLILTIDNLLIASR